MMNSLIEKHTCRLCANSDNNCHSIFDESTNSIVEKIHNCLPIMIDANDKLPTHICDSCLVALNISDKLRTQCILADSLLRKQLDTVPINNIKNDSVSIKIEVKEENPNYEEYNAINDNDGVLEQTCNVCTAKFQSSNDLHEHKREKHENKYVSQEKTVMNYTNTAGNLIEINDVEQSIDIKEEIPLDLENNHIATVEHSETPCDTCGTIIKNQKFKKLHMKFHEARAMFCNNCFSTFPSPYYLYIHKKTIHNIWRNSTMKWFCEKCETITGNERCIKKHINQCKKKKLRCKYCNQEFVYKKELDIHQRGKHYNALRKDANLKKFTCKCCDKTYFDREGYQQHLRRQRAIKDGKYKCPYCAKISSSSYLLKNHIQGTHDRKMIFKCDVCSKEFYNKSNMRAHQRLHNKLTCSRCDEQFETLTILDKHLHEAHGAVAPKRGNYTCKECGARFRRLLLLQDHENMHTGKRPYACVLCNKTFRTYTNHWAHQQRHKTSGFYCDYCKKKFLTKRNLKKHIPSHQQPEDWLYNCEICHVKFPNDAQLQRHMAKDRNKHTRICDLCGLKILGLSRLQRHMSQKHDIWENHDSS